MHDVLPYSVSLYTHQSPGEVSICGQGVEGTDITGAVFQLEISSLRKKISDSETQLLQLEEAKSCRYRYVCACVCVCVGGGGAGARGIGCVCCPA